jgi:hypothetical protein
METTPAGLVAANFKNVSAPATLSALKDTRAHSTIDSTKNLCFSGEKKRRQNLQMSFEDCERRMAYWPFRMWLDRG